MTLPEEGSAGLVTWTEPRTRRTYSVIVAADFGSPKDSLEAWERYRGELGEVKEVFLASGGIEGLPVAEDLLAKFVALGSTGTALALSGATCGWKGEGPHGTARILRELGVGKRLLPLVFEHGKLHLVRLDGHWMAGIEEERSR